MTYYINPIWFYLMNVGDAFKTFLYIGGTAILLIVGIFFIGYFVDNWNSTSDINDADKALLKTLQKILVASIIAIIIGIFVPSKVTCIEMMVASQVTHENVSATKEEIYEIVDYITDKVDSEDKE